MAQGKIVVETIELENAAKKIDSLADTYHENYMKLYDYVKMLGEMSWQGKDNEAFTNQINQFRNDFENMEHIVRDYADFLRKTSSGYKTTQNYIKDGAERNLATSI